MLVMLEALIAGMGVALPRENASRLGAMEGLFHKLGIYLQKGE
jgi:hypothetical protein